MLFSAARSLFSTLHGVISTGLDVFHRHPSQTTRYLNQELSVKIKGREEHERQAKHRAIAREEARRRAEMHGMFREKQHKSHRHHRIR